MIIPFVKSWPMGVCVLTAGAASLVTMSLPYKLGIMVSAFAGIAAGLLTEHSRKNRKAMVQA
jgi:predicted branched-subunit amino acid permease